MNKKTLILGLLICIMAISIFLIGNYDNRSYQKQKEETSFATKLAIILVDENGNETAVEEYPDSSEYYLNFAKSYCQNGSTIGWDNVNNKVTVTSNKKDSCKLYFTKGTETVNLQESVTAVQTLSSDMVDFGVATVDGEFGLYSAEDDYGTSYYFRGDVENNYVQFGTYIAGSIVNGETYEIETPMYWRIVRINGNGTIRLVYDGTSALNNGVNRNASVYTGEYNLDTNEAKYVGYTYDSANTNSAVKTGIDNWYASFLKDNYGKYIADSVFCNDTSDVNSDQIYDSVDRITNSNPTLICTQSTDKYTISDLTGNGKLTHPVGLLTADEWIMAGATTTGGVLYLSDSNISEWTMTPYSYTEESPNIWFIDATNNGSLSTSKVNQLGSSARPVINLRADLLFTGTGLIDDPYKVAGFE